MIFYKPILLLKYFKIDTFIRLLNCHKLIFDGERSDCLLIVLIF